MARVLEGIVVSDKMDKTVVVVVTRVKTHPIYRKKFKITKKYHVHDGDNRYKVGDLVQITETRPVSKTKNWRVVKASGA